MRTVSFAIVAVFLLVWSHSGAADDPGSTPYQPECDSFAQAIQEIRNSLAPLQALGIGASVNCTQDADCTGFGCVLTIDSNSVKLRVKLHPCEDPPQMSLLVQDPDTETSYIEETVSHGDTFVIPGLQINYLGFVTLDVAIGVDFEKVDDGFQIGLDLVFEGEPLSPAAIPLLPPTVIHTPDCSTDTPDLQCTKMQELVDSLNPPYGFTCSKEQDCKGFTCSGTVPIGPQASFPIIASGVLESCTDPISYTLTLYDPSHYPYWSHQFVRSETTDVEGSDVTVPDGVKVSLNVTLEPYTLDIDYLITTIELIVCAGRQCITDVFIDLGLVPIPPCDHPMTLPPAPQTSTPAPPLTSSPDECSAMEAIAHDIESSSLFSADDVTCDRFQECDGFTCNMFTRGQNFILLVKLFHCEDPVRLLFRIDGTDEGSNVHIAQNVTQNDEVSIASFVPQGKVKFFLSRRSSVSIEVAVNIELEGPGGIVISVPLIEDRLITVPPCPTTMSGRVTSTPVPSSHVSVTKPPSKSSSTPASQTKPGSKPNNPNKPNSDGNKDKNTGSQPAGQGARIGLGIAIPLIAIVAVVALMYFWFRRRTRTPTDNLNLIENSSAPVV